MRFLPRLALLCGALFVLCGITPGAAFAQSGAIGLRGDVTADGQVTAADALAVLSHVVGKTLPAAYTAALDGDADGNGQVTALDALVILSHVVGKDVSRYPVGRRILSGLVGSGGGSLVSRADSIRLDLPEGALAEPVLVTMEPARGISTDGKLPGSLLALGPDGLRFAQPVRLTLRFDPAAVPQGVAAEQLRIHRRVGEGWEEVPGGAVDLAAGTVTALLGGSGTYAVMPGAAAGLVLVKESGDGQTGRVGMPPADFLTARLVNAAGRGVPGQELSWTVLEGGGSIRPLEARTDTAGRVRAVLTLGAAPGLNRVQVSAPGAQPVVFTATAVSSTPSGIAVVAGGDQTAAAGSTLPTAPSVKVTDSQGNPVPDVTVAFAVASGGGSVAGATPKTDASGIATLGSWTLGTTAGPNSLTASVQDGPSTIIHATGIPGAAASFAKQSGDGGTAVVATSRVLEAKVSDAHGNGVPGVTVGWAVASGGGSVAVPSSVTDGAGVATVVWTFGTAVGAQSVTATSTGLTDSPLTFSATATVAAPAQITKTAGDAQSAVAGTPVGTAPQVTVTDQYGNPVAGVSVTFAASGDGSVTGSPATTNAGGVATVGSWTLATAAGANTLSATAGALSATFSATGNPGAAAKLAFTVQPTNAQAGSAITPAVQVTIQDALGNTVTTATDNVAVALGSNPSGGTLSGGGPVAAVDGVATFSGLSIDRVGAGYTLAASSGALTAATSSTFDITPGAAANLARHAGDGQSAAVNAAVAVAPSVRVTDASGNPVPDVAVTFAVASGGGSVTGAAQTTGADGIATVGSWTLGSTAGANTLTATAGALNTTFTATGTPGAASGANSTLATSAASLPADGTSTATLTVRLKDQFGNDLTAGGATVALSTTAGTASAVTDNGNGTYTATLTAGTAVATATVSGTVNGSALGNTVSVEFTAGPPANLARQAGDGQSAAVNTTVAVAPSVRVTDASGIPVPNVAVTFAVASGSGSITGAAQTTGADGIATVGSWTLGSTAGANTLTATAGALNTTFTATGTPGAATKLVLTVQPTNAQAGSAITPAVQVTIQDALGNTVTTATDNVAVALGSNPSGGTLSGTATVAAVSGVATFSNLSIDRMGAGYTLAVSSGALTGATSNAFDIIPGAAASLAFTAQPTNVQAGSAITPAVQVTIRDAQGNTVTTATDDVTITLGNNPGGGTLSGTATVAAVNGVATFSGLSINRVGAGYTLAVSSGALTGATSNAFDVTAGPAAALAFSVQPSTAVASAPITPAVQVSITDAFGNPATGSTDNVTLAIGNNPSGGTLSGTTTVAATGGVATFSNLSINLVGTGYTLTASSGALSGATSAGFSVTHGPLDHFLVEAAGGGAIGSQTVGTPFNVRVTAQDAYNNTVTGFTGTVGFTSTPGGGISAGATSGAFTAGVLSSHGITFGTPGSFTLTATRTAGSESGTSNAFDVQAPPTAVNEGPDPNSSPGQPYHAFYSTSGSPQTFNLSAPGVLSNDNLGFPAATITSFGADSLGGSVTTYAAGSTVSPLPGTGRTTGSLSVGANGAITFTPPDGFTGNYVFRYRLTNARGTSDGQVTIAVGARPAAESDTYSPTLVGNVPINTATSTRFRVTANDQGDAKTLAIVGQSSGTAAFNADSTFVFRPSPGHEGPASFTYTVTNGFGTSAPATVSMTVGTPIWFVNAGAGAGGDGRFDAPFNSLPSLAAINNGTGSNPADNDRIFLYSGGYTGGLALRAGQRLIGQGATASLSSIAGVTWPADAGPEPAMGGAAPTISTSAPATPALTLGSTNVLRGFTLGNATGAALGGSSFGTLTVSEVAIHNTTGQALNLATGTLSGSFSSVSSAGGANNLLLSAVSTPAVVNLGTGALSGATGASVSVAGGSASVVYAGDVSQANNAPLLSVSGGHTGTLTFNTGTLTATGGTGLQFNNADGTYAFNGTTTLNGGDAGVDILNGSDGVFTFSSGTSITSPSGVALEVVGGTPAVVFDGSITNNVNRPVRIASITGDSVRINGDINSTNGVLVEGISGGTVRFAGNISGATPTAGITLQNNTGGTIAFTGASQQLTTSSGTGVNLSNNNGATIQFAGGGLAITTTSGNGFSATGGGTVTVAGANNTIASTGGVALRVESSTIGASGLAFRSISANGGSNGIVLSNTGTAGGLTVTGSGTAGSGGTIQNTVGGDGTTAGIGVYLNNASNVSLSRMQINDHQGFGIRGSGVSGFTMQNSVISGANGTSGANPFLESSIFFTELTGTATFTSVAVSGGRLDNLRVKNTTGTLNFSFSGTGCAIRNNSTSTDGNMGLAILPEGSAVITASVSGCTFQGNRTIALRGDAAGSSQLTFNATNNTIVAGTGGNNQGNQGIEISTSADAQVTFDLNANQVGTDGATAQPLLNTGINVFGGNRSTLTGKVRGNMVANNASVAAGTSNGFGIRVFANDTANIRANVDANTVSGVSTDYGILVEASGADTQVPPTGTGTVDVAVTNNTANVLSGAIDAMRVQARHNNRVCARISGNASSSAGSGFFGLFVRQVNAATFRLEGLTGGAAAYLAAQNPAVTSGVGDNGGTFTTTAANSCNIPAL